MHRYPWLGLVAGAVCAVGAHFLPAPPGTEILIQLLGIWLAGRSTAITPPRR